MHSGFKIFIDFDGTVTTVDVGDAIFRKFGDKPKVDEIIEDLLAGRVPAKESWSALCRTVDSVNKEELDAFIGTIQIDKGFKDFVAFCKEHNHDLFILSDGFDYYIDQIFRREGIEGLNVYSNRLSVSGGKLIPSFPYFDSEFLSSANCKRNHILSNSSDDDFTFYIGDGYSDKYSAPYCDFIFAKNDLLKFCEIERITYYPFNGFSDVTEKMIQLTAKKRLRKRHRAILNRKNAYKAE